jgi:sigma-B regulation protein RsbU (phosphoserine phosphatase)
MKVRVLVADDQSFWRKALEESLLENGHRVIVAESGAKAWQVLETEADIDLLVTDWVMPEMDGMALCRRARAMERSRYLPIIMMTSRGESSDLVSALEAGADAFVRKPFDEPELLAQIRVVERIIRLESGLERRIEELRLINDRTEKDLTSAAEIQRSFMPPRPPDVPGVSFAWHFQPSRHLGGDIFNVVSLDDDHVGIHVLDVSGHGVSAALHSVALSHVLHPNNQQGGILKRVSPRGGDAQLVPPAQVAQELNLRFPLIERSGHYFTFFYGVLELSTRRFHYVRAGHPGPVHVSHGQAETLDRRGGVPVGVTSDAEWDNCEVRLESGDQLLLFTDGLFENLDVDGNEFGMERILDIAVRHRESPIETTVRALERGLHDFCKLEPPRDDVTIVGLRID